MTTTPSNPGNINAVEIWEVRQGEIQGEETEAQAAIIEAFKASPEAQALKNGLSKIPALQNPNAVFERVVSLYAKNGENLEQALSDSFSPPHSIQIGLPEIGETGKKTIVQGLTELINSAGKEEETSPDKTPTEGEEGAKKPGEQNTQNPTNSLNADVDQGGQNTKIEENPGYPMLQRFAADGKISPEEFRSITEAMTPTGEDEELVSLIKTHIGDSGVQAELLAIFGEQDPEVAKENFFKDANVPEGSGKGEQEDPITALIGENYIQISNKEGRVDVEADTKLAIQTAANKTIARKHIERDVTIQDAIDTIQAGESIPQMVQSLRVLHEKVNTGEGMKDGERPEEDGDTTETGERDQEDMAGVLGEINQIIKDAQAQSDSVRVAKAEKLKATLEAEDKVKGGEAGMGGGELDALLQEISLPTKSA